MLNDFLNMTIELQNTSSSNDKKDILKKYPQCQKLLHYTYNPLFNYYITSENIKKQEKTITLTAGPNLFNSSFGGARKPIDQFTTIFDLLDALNSRKITGLSAVRAVLSFVKRKENIPYRDLIFSIIDRDLKCRVDGKLINKVYPNLIPLFNVALANSYWDISESIDFTKEKYYASRKMDGIRVITLIDENGNIKCISRNGKEIDTLELIKEEIKHFFPQLRNYVFDGEICIVDDDGTEHFNEIMKQINRKNYTISSPRYKIFDLLHYDEFFPGESKVDFSKRLERWNHITKNEKIKSDMINLLPQTVVLNKKHLEDLFAEAQSEGWEGLILRRDTTYKGKRSNDLLKVKSFFDAEYRVIRAENGPFQVVIDGKEVTETMMTRVFIQHKGFEVGVGSGFTLDERRAFYRNPEKIVGKTISVKYFEETTNQNGTVSLRFPTVKGIYGDKRFDTEESALLEV